MQIENLYYKHEDGSVALKNLNLKIRRGEFLAILGHNGAGKTTLARHLIGFNRPSSGKVLLDGNDIKQCSPAMMAQHVGYLFQNPDSQIFTDNVFEEIRFGLENLGLPEDEIQKRTDSALETMELSEYRDRHPHALSRGQRQRLAVASILSMEPELLVLDEPTTGQDRGHTHKFLDRIRELNRLGKTVVIITHDMELVAEYAERVVLLKQGQILLDGSTAEVFSNQEKMDASGLVPPFTIRLSQDLRKQGIEIPPLLTVAEMKRYLQTLCPDLSELKI
jgi:energy-coupling factor transport system ATP-binding protein